MNHQGVRESDLNYLTVIDSILLRCFIVGTIALTFAWGVSIIAHQPIERLHESLLGISSHEFNLFLYGFLTLIKCLNVVLFLFPWIAIKHYLYTHAARTKPTAG